ncbi:MAG: SH3 domain-containing protein [Candidatus Aminicenantes bacterium]|jgi:hypothetical protein
MSNKHVIKYFFLSSGLIFLTLFLALTAAAGQQKVRVTVDRAIIRFEPSTDSQLVTVVNRGDVLDVKGKEGNWFLVDIKPSGSDFTLSGFIQDIEVEQVVSRQEAVSERLPERDVQPSISQIMTAPPQMRYAQSGKILYTTSDFPYAYDIIGVITHFKDVASTGRDPFSTALGTGMEEFEIKVMERDADAVVGLRYSLIAPTSNSSGKILIYGTAIRFQ